MKNMSGPMGNRRDWLFIKKTRIALVVFAFPRNVNRFIPAGFSPSAYTNNSLIILIFRYTNLVL